MFSICSNKFLNKTYTIRFCIRHHYDNVDVLNKISSNELPDAIKNFCEEKDILIKEIFYVNFDDNAFSQNISHTYKTLLSNFVKIYGTKNDFHLLYDFLLNYQKDNVITLLTVRR